MQIGIFGYFNGYPKCWISSDKSIQYINTDYKNALNATHERFPSDDKIIVHNVMKITVLLVYL